MEKERKKGKKRKTPQNCKNPTQRQRFITTIKSVTEYTYTYTPISKIKTVQQKLSTIDSPGEERKPKMISTRTKLIKPQTGGQN